MKVLSSAWIFLLTCSVAINAQQLNPSDRSAAEGAMKAIRASAIRAHMEFLSDRLLEGRAPGTRGYDIAALYVATELEAIELRPAGTNGTWFQTVPVRKAVPNGSKSSIVLVGNGKEQKLADAVDYVFFGDVMRRESTIEAPLVFVGFGVTAPELDYDDYRGTDVQGKIVVEIGGAPPRFSSTQRAYYSEGLTKAGNAAAHGAVGLVFMGLPEDEKRNPWAWVVPQVQMGDMQWLDEKQTPHDAFPQLRAVALLSHHGSELLFGGAPRTLEQVYTTAHASEPQAFQLPLRAKIHAVSSHTALESPNIIGEIRGSDPALRSQYVVYTAHLDHLGICPEVAGDNVCHGAWDNASGDASLLEIARAFTRLQPAPRRSVLFLFTTGEEIGFLGSGYFAHFPTIPLRSIVANINIDGAPGLLGSRKDMVNFCAGHSSLDKAFELAAAQAGYDISPDPMPEENVFVRSDQYSFIVQGVPAVFINDGVKATDEKVDGLGIFKKYLTTQYHTPLDNMSQPFDYESASKGTRLNFLVGYQVAQQDQSPTWNGGDFFGIKFGPRHTGSAGSGN
jgi:hypothetical protein